MTSFEVENLVHHEKIHIYGESIRNSLAGSRSCRFLPERWRGSPTWMCAGRVEQKQLCRHCWWVQKLSLSLSTAHSKFCYQLAAVTCAPGSISSSPFVGRKPSWPISVKQSTTSPTSAWSRWRLTWAIMRTSGFAGNIIWRRTAHRRSAKTSPSNAHCRQVWFLLFVNFIPPPKRLSNKTSKNRKIKFRGSPCWSRAKHC